MGNSREEESSEGQSKGQPREAGTGPGAPQASCRESFKNRLVVRESAVRCYNESAPWAFCVWQYRFFKKKLSKQLLWGYWGPECQPAGSGRVTGKVMVDIIDADNYFEICSKRWQGGRQEAWWMMRVESFQIGNTCTGQ